MNDDTMIRKETNVTDEVHSLDKTNWSDGPWMNEPDKVQWTTKVGLLGLIVRNFSGVLCGYAAVTAAHPWYEKNYADVDADIEVHGGLTYSDHCQGPICHVPEPGQPDDVWWFGFDCAHSWDVMPASLALSSYGNSLRAFSDLTDAFSDVQRPQRMDVYRDLAYVTEQVEQLAAQLVAQATR